MISALRSAVLIGRAIMQINPRLGRRWHWVPHAYQIAFVAMALEKRDYSSKPNVISETSIETERVPAANAPLRQKRSIFKQLARFGI
jgi:hypothetical protein